MSDKIPPKRLQRFRQARLNSG